MENVILHQRRKEKHTLSVSGSTVHFQTETVRKIRIDVISSQKD